MPEYKALICDVDGTLIPNRRDGLASQRVIDAIAKIKDQIHVGIATSRPLFMLDHIFAQLQLSGPCVITGGTQIYDAAMKKVVWEKRIETTIAQQVANILQEFNRKFMINDGDSERPYQESEPIGTPLTLFIDNLEPDLGEILFRHISTISEVSVQKLTSHFPGKIDLDITHALATKQHGIFEVSKLLNIPTSEIIGIGDGHNDFPLLMACGLKVAMGNAVEELKAIADYIAPTVDEDGVAYVIEKFCI